MQTQVSIAFRRSALRLRCTRRDGCKRARGSPLPFGVLPSGYLNGRAEATPACQWSPLPFGVLPSGYEIKKWDGSTVEIKEVSIAFRRSALRLRTKKHWRTPLSMWSPLPFGVLPSGYKLDTRRFLCCPLGLHCLSAFCPPATGQSWFNAQSDDSRVSIAFRRSALRLRGTRQLRCQYRSRCLHCLSAFCQIGRAHV